MRVLQILATLMLLSLLSISGPVFSNPAPMNACVADDTTLCLNNQRFKVEIEWMDFAGNEFTVANTNQGGDGQAVAHSEDTGFFWFTTDGHIEVMAKVLDGCAINNRFWVFAAATTNVEYTLKVTDTGSGSVRTYTKPFGTPSPAITDTEAFATCPGTVQRSNNTGPLVADPLPVSRAAPASCMADATTMCLHGDRFSVKVDWTDFHNNTGAGRGTNLGDKSGHFWFFNPGNIEMIINIIDGRASNGSFWVYFATTTNVAYTVSVTDTVTGLNRTYSNPLGVSSPAVLDNMFSIIPPPSPVPSTNSFTRFLLMMLLALLGWRAITMTGRRRAIPVRKW